MRVRARVPRNTVDIFLNDVSLDDIKALIFVLDPDRNHPARAALYERLQHAAALLDQEPYKEFGFE